CGGADGRRETAERAGAPPSSVPPATPGVTPGRGSLLPAVIRSARRCARKIETEIGGMFCTFRPGIPPTKNEVIVASSMGPIGPTRRDVDAGILPGLLHFAWVHLGKWQPSVRMLDIATDFRASAQLQRSRAGGALGDSLTLRELTHFERV